MGRTAGTRRDLRPWERDRAGPAWAEVRSPDCRRDAGLADLRVRYLGLELRSPLVASPSPLTGSLEGLKRLEQAGADALELNIYYVSSRPGLSGNEVEWHYLDVVRAVRQAIAIPLAVKLSPYFSSLVNLASQLVEAGANGLVLFNRFYQPDLDIEAMAVRPALALSTSTELGLPLRWIAILHRRHRVSLAASTGVHSATDALKVLLAGADVAMLTSALLRNGPEHIAVVERELRAVLAGHDHDSVSQLRGSMSRDAMPDPAGFERANYVRTLLSWSSQTQVSPGQATTDEPTGG
jgi:dihydroorotate dehydrogenase (fumarate)